jgi:hypothetical protein
MEKKDKTFVRNIRGVPHAQNWWFMSYKIKSWKANPVNQSIKTDMFFDG